MKKLLLVLFIAIILGACAPSESAVNTAIAQTQAANPTPTFTPKPTFTPTPTITPTITPSPSPTPDLRVIKIEPKEFLLKADDLPPEGKYYLPASDWISPHHNSEIIQSMGAEKGKAYINETERVDGWIVSYKRRAKNTPLPVEMYDNVIMYQSSNGVAIFMDKYAPIQGYIEIETAPTIGDKSQTYMLKKDGNIDYVIIFAYRNYVHRVAGFGLEADVSPTIMENIARLLLKKLQEAPLSSL